MRLYELVEDIFEPNGYVAKISTPKPNKPNIGTTNNVATTNNVSPSSTPTKPIAPLNKGAVIGVPMGNNNQKVNMKVMNVSNGNVTIANPLKPNDPALTYSQDAINQLLNGGQENGNNV